MSRLALAFPWLALVVVLFFITLDQRTQRSTLVIRGPGAAQVSTFGEDLRGLAVDPVCQMSIRRRSAHRLSMGDQHWYFCTTACREEFMSKSVSSSARVRAGFHLMRGLPTWMLQTGVVLVIVLSFGVVELLGMTRRGAGPGMRALGARLNVISGARMTALIRWPWTRPVAQGLVLVAFTLVVAAGLFGNQDPSVNIAPLATWTVWWVGLVFLVLFLGKSWCYVCPWDAVSSLAAHLAAPSGSASGSLDFRWPTALRNIWIAVGLFILLTWVELGLGITFVPRATAYLGLGMVALAVTSALIFERKSFCRYACLVGRVSGLYSLFGSLELRPTDPAACESCKTMDCYRGNERGAGCPTFEFPKTMSRSTYCILCTECVKTCPKNNIAISLRPWAADLVEPGKGRWDEAMMCLTLLAMTAFHGLTMTPAWESMNARLQGAIGVGPLGSLALWMAVFIGLPSVVFAGLCRATAWISGRHTTAQVFLEYSYVLLPIALFYHLAHNAEHFLIEGPRLVRLLSDPFGHGWNLFGTAHSVAAPLVTLEGLWILQLALVVLGHVYSLWLSERVTHRLVPERARAFFSQLPMLAAMVLCSLYSLWLLGQPMSMRSSGM